MTYRVITPTEVMPFDWLPNAVTAYTAAVVAHPHEHITLIEGEELPGMPPKVIAERFGSPPPPTYTPRYVGP